MLLALVTHKMHQVTVKTCACLREATVGEKDAQLKADECALGHDCSNEEHVDNIGEASIIGILDLEVEEDLPGAGVPGGHQREDQNHSGPPNQEEHRREQRVILSTLGGDRSNARPRH